MNRIPIHAAIVATLVSVLVLTLWSGGTIARQATPESDATPATEANVVQVELTEFEIRMPEELPAGETTFEVTNVGDAEHNFEVEGQGIEEEFEENLQPGETKTMTLDLAPGTYEVYCPVGDHAERGMRLELTVTDEATPTAGTPVADDADEAAAEEVTVEMVDIDFNPNEFAIPATTEVTVRLPNRGEIVHNFHIDPLDIHSEDVQPGGETTVTINAESGDYEYYCSIPGHREAGMVGTVHVE